jgi:hypothetical protein
MKALDPIFASALFALSETLATLAKQCRRGDIEQADPLLRALRALLTLSVRLGAEVGAEPLPGHVSAVQALPVLLEWVSLGLRDYTARPGCDLGIPWAELHRACRELVAIERERVGADERRAA